MVNNISWASYWYAVVTLLAIYYISIGLFCYRDEFRKVFLKTYETHQHSVEVLSPQILQHQALSDEIQAYVNQATFASPSKEQMMESLRTLVSKYKPLQNTSHKESIKRLVLERCASLNVQLTSEDVEGLWMV